MGEGALTCEVQQAGIGGYGAVGLHNPVVTTWGRCPQTPGIYRFEPGAGFKGRGLRNYRGQPVRHEGVEDQRMRDPSGEFSVHPGSHPSGAAG
jgi:hypothetical protein